MDSPFYSRLRYLIEQEVHNRLALHQKGYLTAAEIKEQVDNAEANFAQDLYEFITRQEIV
jgi:hypothetical protein